MTPPLPLDEAQRRLLALAQPLGAERISAERAMGRYLAADLAARSPRWLATTGLKTCSC